MCTVRGHDHMNHEATYAHPSDAGSRYGYPLQKKIVDYLITIRVTLLPTIVLSVARGEPKLLRRNIVQKSQYNTYGAVEYSMTACDELKHISVITFGIYIICYP